MMSDEDLAKYKVNRPPANQSVWIASHKDGEDPDSH
jgi:frataxin-like iron-binding protein CyaY